MLEYDLIVIAREKDYRCVLLFHFLVESIPKKVLQFLDSFLCE
jgi:hypothetical protein